MRVIGEIDKEIVGCFGSLQTNQVVVTEERMKHIKEEHPEAYELFDKYASQCVSSPDLVITDERHQGTIYMLSKINGTNLNTVIRLALITDAADSQNTVITFWKIRDKNVEKLVSKNKLLYKKE